MILYVKNNEETSCIKLIHFNEQEEGVPSELGSNAKSTGLMLSFIDYWHSCPVLDEAFPEITIDLVRILRSF